MKKKFNMMELLTRGLTDPEFRDLALCFFSLFMFGLTAGRLTHAFAILEAVISIVSLYIFATSLDRFYESYSQKSSAHMLSILGKLLGGDEEEEKKV
jgi:hypothetical protein